MPGFGLGQHHSSSKHGPIFFTVVRFIFVLLVILPIHLVAGTSTASVSSSTAGASMECHVICPSRSDVAGADLKGLRVGEASHPGPPNSLLIGTTNPGGLRNKELLAVGQGCGI